MLKINGMPAGTLTAKELEAGVNLTSLGPAPAGPEPIRLPPRAGRSWRRWRPRRDWSASGAALSQKAHAAGAAAELKEQLAALTKKVEEADAKIREAAKPQKLHFELTPAE